MYGGKFMLNTLPIIEARKKLTSMPEALRDQSEPSAIAVTRHGVPVLALMSWEAYESLLETLEIMSDETLAPLLKKSLEEAAKRKTVSWETVKKRLHE